MRIRYDVTVDDLLAFAYRQSGRSGRSSRTLGTVGIVWGVVAPLGLIAMVTIFMGKEAALMMLPLAVLSIVIILTMFPKLGFRPNTRGVLRKLYEESLPREATGPHELELVEDDLMERTPFSVRRTPLRDIQRISSDGEHTFIYFGSAMAYVIPKQSVSEGDPEEFADAVRASMSANSGEQDEAPDG